MLDDGNPSTGDGFAEWFIGNVVKGIFAESFVRLRQSGAEKGLQTETGLICVGWWRVVTL
jgi:hypothetical protein